MKVFDGIHKPRQIQLDILSLIEEWRGKVEVIGIQAPCGVGKSAVGYIAGDTLITSANALLDQYANTYSDLNVLKGSEHYQCEKHGNCRTPKNLNVPRCPQCPYLAARAKAMTKIKTIANPLSYYYVSISKNYKVPDTLVVDEAHTLVEMLSLAGEMEFSKTLYNPPRLETPYAVMGWLQVKIPEMIRKKQLKQIGKLQRVFDALKREPHNFGIVETEDKLILYPIKALPSVMDRVTRCKTLVLLSATLFEDDVKRITNGRSYKLIKIPSVIPADRRKVLFRPMAEKPDIPQVIGWIDKQVERYKSLGVLCHVTYRQQALLQPLMKNSWVNTPANKTEVMEQFCKHGGLWLAAGCHEGLSFDYDKCRLNLIPTIQYANWESPLVQQRFNQANGPAEYELQALKRLVQQIGRTTRAVDDMSVTVVGDKRFKYLINTYKDQLCQSFLDSIDWGDDALN